MALQTGIRSFYCLHRQLLAGTIFCQKPRIDAETYLLVECKCEEEEKH
jgi:hypothetical protein